MSTVVVSAVISHGVSFAYTFCDLYLQFRGNGSESGHVGGAK